MLIIPPGADRLGSAKLTAAGLTTSTVSFGAYDFIWILASITGMSVADTPKLRFNGITTVANYTQRTGYYATAASATASTLADNGATNGAIILTPVATVNPIMAVITINNHVQSTFKTVTVELAISSAAGTTEINPLPLHSAGQFVAASAATQVTSAVLLTTTNNMLTGSGFIVFGMNM